MLKIAYESCCIAVPNLNVIELVYYRATTRPSFKDPSPQIISEHMKDMIK